MTAAMPILSMTPRTIQIRLAARWEMARRNPVYFLRWFVFTNRPGGTGAGPARENIVTPFPMRPHLLHSTQLWLDNQLLLFVKNRQMLLTWWLSALVVWDAMFHRNRLIMAQCQTEEAVIGDRETGDGLLGRAKFILDHIPASGLLGCKPGRDVAIQESVITFSSTSSTVQGIAQGGNKIRQRTPSGIASDECAFQPEFEQAFTASMPCLRSGGWFCAVTTADMGDHGFTRRMFRDEGDA